MLPVEWFAPDIDGISFKLFDMWNEKQYRDDEFWNAHKRQWVFMVRYKEGYKYEWSNKKLHCGRFPLNACSKVVQSNYDVLHMGWAREVDRIEKYNRYMVADGSGTDGSLQQYISILDKNPCVKEYKKI